MRGSEVLVRSLKNQGVEYVFGLFGDDLTHLPIDIRDSGIKFITTRHEHEAVIMADIWGRLSKEPGVCFSTLGPGAMNMVTGLANASQDRSPIVALSDQLPSDECEEGSHQYVPIRDIMQHVTKWSTILKPHDNVTHAISRAFAVAMSEHPGPVHITLVRDMLNANFEYRPSEKVETRELPYDDSIMNFAAELIGEAKDPLILAGGVVNRLNAHEELKQFAERYEIPVMTTFHGKNSIAADHPLFIGTVSRHLSIYEDIFKRADLLIAIGYDYTEGIKPSVWKTSPEPKVLHIDTAPNDSRHFYRPHVELVGDIRRYLRYFIEKTGPKHEKSGRTIIPATERDKVQRILNACDDETYPFRPQQVLKCLGEVVGPNDVLTCDVGLHKQYIGLMFNPVARSRVLFSNGLSTMAFALPAATAAKLYKLHKSEEGNVIAIVGDGGLNMMPGPLNTARRLGLPYVVIVMNDGGYGLIRSNQERICGTTYQVDVDNPDFSKLGEAYGFVTYRPAKKDDLREIFETSLKSGKHTLIDIPIQYQAKWFG